MIFIHYISLYLQYTDIYGCKYNKKKWDWQTFKSFFLTFCIFHENDVRSRLQMTQIHPFFILAHKCFFLEKSLKVSLFADKLLIHNDLQNATSKYVYKEVS